MGQADGQLVAQVVGGLEEVGVVVGHAHVHHADGVEAHQGLLAQPVDGLVGVEVADVGQPLPRLGRFRALGRFRPRLATVLESIVTAALEKCWLKWCLNRHCL